MARGLGVLGGGDVADEVLQVDGDPALARVLDDGVPPVVPHGRTLLGEGAAQRRTQFPGLAPGESGEVQVGAVPVTEAA